MTLSIKTFFDHDTATFSHVISDPDTQKAAVIDSVLSYDQYSGRTCTKSADILIDYIKQNTLTVEWILETHIHADHITAAKYLKQNLGGKTAIGASIKNVLKLWIPIFNSSADTPLDGSQFDKLFEDNELFQLGNLNLKVLYTPGHTPACSSYLVEDAVFVGDTLFMPDVGTGRTDFPGGNAATMYDSIQRILSLPDDTRLFACHDYPPQERNHAYLSTVKEQKENNVLIHSNVSKKEYILKRNQRDKGKSVPKLLLPSIQVNLRSGDFGHPESNEVNYVKIPVDKI